MPSFSRSSESTPSVAFHEAIMDSVSSVRDSIPKQHRVHFEALRQEIIDFVQVHNIPRAALTKPQDLQEAASKLSTPDLEQLANLLERFEYLLVKKEPREGIFEALEYAQEFYHLEKQYASQVELLEQVGILKDEAIMGIDGKQYFIPTLEQIASRLFERREELSTKHDQGFTKLLLVPFGMSLDVLISTLERFLVAHKEGHSHFGLNIERPLCAIEDYQGADIGESPYLVYYPRSFAVGDHQSQTKAQILKTNEQFPGWTIHLFQPSDPKDLDSLGFAPIPRKGKGTTHGKGIPRPSLEVGKTLGEHLFTLQKFQDDQNSPYFQESGLTPEDWVMAFMIHLKETGQPLDNWRNDTENMTGLIGSFFRVTVFVPCASWYNQDHQVDLRISGSHRLDKRTGVRSSVII